MAKSKKEKPKKKAKAAGPINPVKMGENLPVEIGKVNQELEGLNIVKLGQDETGVVVFTKKYGTVPIHYIDIASIRGFYVCNQERGKGRCVLCQVGKEAKTRYLIPVYLLESSRVELLSCSDVLRPNALLPLMMNVMSSGKKVAVFITKTGYDFSISTFNVPDDEKKGIGRVIRKFNKRLDTDEVNFSDSLSVIENEMLTKVPEIEAILKFKGLTE